jgi:hypothetical protein
MATNCLNLGIAFNFNYAHSRSKDNVLCCSASERNLQTHIEYIGLISVWISQNLFLFTFQMLLTIKANEMHYFSNLFDKVLYMFWTCPLSIIRSIWTLYTRSRYLSF